MSSRYLLVLCACACTLALLQVNAEEPRRCTYGAAGDLVGREIFLNRSTVLPVDRRQYRHKVVHPQECVLNGVSAKVCDLYSPEVEVEAGLGEVRVRRLGPRLRPLTVDIYLYCDPQH